MLTEDDVIDAVHSYLSGRGWRVLSRATARQRGDDLVAERGTTRLVIEAKGGGSSKPTTARFGQNFSSGQVFDHVAKAVLKALRVVDAGKARAGIALPDNELHRKEIALVGKTLREIDVAVFWVGQTRAVDVESPWEV